jgi:hypothetical protein
MVYGKKKSYEKLVQSFDYIKQEAVLISDFGRVLNVV